MLPEFNPSDLKNRYIAVRHGQSTANVSRIIFSSLELGKTNAGLTELGKEQAKLAGENLSAFVDPHNTVVYASPFLRTVQTAEIICQKLGLPFQTDPRLRERYYGRFEGLPAGDVYDQAWVYDKKYQSYDPTIDTPEMIAQRNKELIQQIETTHQNKTIILVSHGDPIQVIKTLFTNVSPYLHHTAPEVLPYVKNAEVVKLKY